MSALAAFSSSAKPLCGVLHPRGQGASCAQRTRPTLLGSRGVAAGRPQQGLRQAYPPGLFICAGAQGPGFGELSTPRARAQTRGSPRQRRAQADCVGCWRWVFCFVLKPGVGEGQHLVNEKFPVRETLLAEFLSCP